MLTSAFPVEFFFACALLGILLILFVFLTPRTLGFIFTKLISLFLRNGPYIKIGYMYVTPIGGKVLFKKLVFGNNDYCIRAAAGSFTIRWWPGKVRGYGEEEDIHPCRLELRVSGLEVVWYNNCASFDRFDPSKKDQTIHSTTTTMVLPGDFKLPLLYRLSPAIKLSVTVGSITLGQPDTPALTHITFKRGTGVHLVGPPSCSEDYYRHTTTVDFINAKCRLIKNPDWYPGKKLYYDPDKRIGRLTRIMDFVKSKVNHYHAYHIERRLQTLRPGDGPQVSPITEELYTKADWELGSKVIVAGNMRVRYYVDVQGPVTAQQAKKPVSQENSPKWGTDITIYAGKVTYGPWAERQRTHLFSFLSATNYSEEKVYVPHKGEPREYTQYELNIRMEEGVEVVVPFRNPTAEPSKMQHFTVVCREASKIKFSFDLVCPSEKGYHTLFQSDLRGCTVDTTLTNSPILKTDVLTLYMDILYPRQPNGRRVWDCKVGLDGCQAFPLYDHLNVFSDFMADLYASDKKPTDMDGMYYAPNDVHVHVYANRLTAFINVNDKNVITNPSVLDDNAYFVLFFTKVDADVDIKGAPYKAATREFTFDMHGYKGTLSILFPSHNVNRRMFEDDPVIDWRDTGMFPDIPNPTTCLGIPIVWADYFRASGLYMYYIKYDPSFRDRAIIHFEAGPGDMQLFGFLLTYILALKYNYISPYNHVATAPDQRFPEYENTEGNAMEIYVTVDVTNARLRLPVNLYSCKEHIYADFDKLYLDGRGCSEYFNLCLTFSPIYGHILIDTNEFDTPLCSAYNFKSKHLVTVSDLSFNLHFLFGIPPLGYTYKENYKIKIGAINGNVVTSQLLSLFSFLDHFIDYFLNKENKVNPIQKAKDDNIISLSLDVGYGSLHLWGGHTVTHLSLPAGVKVFLSTYVTHLGNMKVNVFLPKVSLGTYMPAEGTALDYYTQIDDWCEIGSASAALAISVFIKDDTWIEDSVRQKEYLREQDSGSHRLPFLWEHKRKGTKAASVQNMNDLRDLDPQSQTILSEISSNSRETPKRTKRNATQRGKTAESSPQKNYNDSNSRSSESEDREEEEEEEEKEEDEEEDEKDEMVKDNRNFVESVKSSTVKPSLAGAWMGMETGSRCGVSSNSFRSETFGVDSSVAFAKSPFTKHVSLVGVRQTPLSVAPRAELLRFVQQGSSEASLDVKSVTRDNFLETGFESSLSYLLDETNMKTERKQVKAHRNDSGIGGSRYERIHKKNTSTITIVIDSIKEVKGLLSPHIITFVEDVLMSLVLKNTSPRDILDKLQSRAMGQVKTAPTSKHTKVQLITALNGVNMQMIHIQPPLSTSKVFVSRANVGPIQLYFSMCNKVFENQERKTAESSDLLAEQARGLTLPCTQICSLCFSVKLDSVNFRVAQKVPQDISQRFSKGWKSTEELIGNLLNEEQHNRFMNFSVGKITITSCNNTANEDENNLDLGLTLIVSKPSFCASNDIGVLLSCVIPLWVGKLQRIIRVAKHISEVNEKEVKGLVIEILDNELKKLELVQSEEEKLITDYMDVSKESLIQRFIWKDIALLRDFGGKSFKSHFLEHEKRSHIINFTRNPTASTSLNNAYYSFEQTYSDISGTQKGQQILGVIKCKQIASLFAKNEESCERKIPDIRMNANILIPTVEVKFKGEAFDTLLTTSSISLQGVAQLCNNVKDIKLGSALVFEDLDVKFDPEVVEIIKGFVVLGAELFNTLNNTDPTEARKLSGASTTTSKKAAPLTHKFKTQVNSHLRVLFPSARLSVSSSDFGMLILNLKSCSIVSSMCPTVFQHTSLFNIRQVSVELADSCDELDDNKPSGSACISVRNFVISESLMTKAVEQQQQQQQKKIGKKKKKKVKKDEDNSIFVFCVALGVKGIDAQFNSSQKFVVKTLGFEREWEKAITHCKRDLVYIMHPKQNSFPSKTKMKKLTRTSTLAKLSHLSHLSQPPAEKTVIPNFLFSLSLDIGGVRISSNIFPSLPLIFESERFITILSRPEIDKVQIQAQLLKYRLTFIQTDENFSKIKERTVELPSLQLTGEVNKLQSTKETYATAHALIGAWKECIDADIINQFILLKWRLSREIDDMINIWTESSKKEKTDLMSSVTREGDSAFMNSFSDDGLTQSYVESDIDGKDATDEEKEATGPLDEVLKNFHWSLCVTVENSSITVKSPALDVVFKTGDMSFFFKDAPPSPGAVIPFSWKLNIIGVRLIIKDKRQYWGNAVSNIVIRNFIEGNNSLEHDTIWINVHKTQVYVQPGIFERCADTWLYYYKTFVDYQTKLGPSMKFKKKVKVAIETTVNRQAESQLQDKSMSFQIDIDKTSISCPFAVIGDTTPGMIFRLESLKILGTISKSFFLMPPKSSKKALSRKILGACSFKNASLSITDNTSLSSGDLSSDNTKNYAVISNGKFSLALIVSALHITASADFITWGALLSLNPDLIRFVYIFKNSIFSSQANFMKIFEKVKDENAELENDQEAETADDRASEPLLSSPSTDSVTATGQKTHYRITVDMKLSVFNYSLVLTKLTKGTEKPSSGMGFQLKYKATKLSSSAASMSSLPPESEEFKVDFPSFFACSHYTYLPTSTDSSVFESTVNSAVSVGDCNISAPPFVASIVCDFVDKILNQEDSLGSTPATTTEPGNTDQKADSKTVETRDNESEESSHISGTFSLAVGTFDIKLLCVPICEVVCFLKTEPVTCFASFSERGKLLASVTAALPSASLKLHHMQFPDHNTSLYLNSIMLEYSSSRVPFHALLASADSFVINFDIDRIHEIAQFAQVWADPIFGGKHFIVKRKVVRETKPNTANLQQSSEAKGSCSGNGAGTGTGEDNGKEEECEEEREKDEADTKVEKVFPNLVFDSGFNALSVKAKMGEWVGVMKFKISSFRSSAYLANETGFDWPCAMACGDVRKITFTSEGKLSGGGKTDRFSFWSFVDGRSYELKGYTELQPFVATLDYELVQSIAIKCKSFAGSFVSTGRTVSALVRSNGVNVHICPQTIATGITVFSKLYVCVTDQIAIFKHSNYTIPWASEEKKQKQQDHHKGAKEKQNKILGLYNGDLGLEATDFSIWIFESTKDDTWFEFKIGSSSVKFKIEQNAGKAVVRDLIIDGRSIFFSLDHEVKKDDDTGSESDKRQKKKKKNKHMHAKKGSEASEQLAKEHKREKADPWMRENDTTKILEMPDGKLIMHTEKDSPEASVLNVWFNTSFSQPIYVSLDVRLYTQLKDLALFYKTRISEEMERLSSATDLGSIFAGLSKKSPRKEAEPTAGTVAKTTKDKITYVQKLFKLEPVLNVLSDLTPSVSTVLGWAGIESPSETIPKATHEKVSLGAERVLRILITFWNNVQAYFSDQKYLESSK